MSDAATDIYTTLTGAPPASLPGFSAAEGRVVAAKEREAAPIEQRTLERAEAGRAELDERYRDLLKATPEPGAPPAPPQADPWKSWASPATLFGLIASAFTKLPALSAMKSATAAINAQNAGNAQAYKDSVDRWKAETDLAFKRQALMHDEYEDAAQKVRDDLSLGQAEYQRIATKYGDELSLLQLQAGNLHMVQQLDLERQRLAVSMQGAQFKIEDEAAAHAVAAERIAAKEKETGAPLSPGQKAQILLDVKAEETAKSYGLKTAAGESAKQEAELAGFTAEQQHFYALEYLRTGRFPSLGFGGIALRKAILADAEKTAAAQGKTIDDYIESQAALKSDTQSLGILTKQHDAIGGYEAGAEKELDLAASLLPKTPEPLDMQLLTRWARTGETQFGDTATPAYFAALTSGLDEYAKVLMGAYGAQGSTDSARSLALSLIPQGATTDQVKTIIPVLKRGMAFKQNAYEDQIDAIKGRIHGTGDTLESSGQKTEVPELPSELGASGRDANLLAKPAGVSDSVLREGARAAIAAGQNRQAVLDRLHAWGVDASGL